MPLINIDKINEEYCFANLSEKECTELFNTIVERNKFIGSILVVNENHPKILNEKFSIEDMIKGLVDIVSSKYKLTAKKLITQSKELNDIYTKVDDMLRNDRVSRFKHRNDEVNTENRYLVLKDARLPEKDFRMAIDNLAYDPTYFMKEINNIMEYANKYSKDKKSTLEDFKQRTLDKIDSDFERYHAVVKYFKPMMKVVSVPRVRLEKAVMLIKDSISSLYNNIGVYNKYVGAQLQYLQYMQVAYNKMKAQFKSDRNGLDVTNEIFQALIKNASMSMDFNAKCMDILIEIIRWDADEMSKFYDIIRGK